MGNKGTRKLERKKEGGAYLSLWEVKSPGAHVELGKDLNPETILLGEWDEHKVLVNELLYEN